MTGCRRARYLFLAGSYKVHVKVNPVLPVFIYEILVFKFRSACMMSGLRILGAIAQSPGVSTSSVVSVRLSVFISANPARQICVKLDSGGF